MAHTSTESGVSEVYVRPFPNVDDGRYLVSVDGGISPVWSPDGRELFYRNGDAMMVVGVSSDSVFTAGAPAVLFRGEYAGGFAGPDGRIYDIFPDGDRFLMLQGGDTNNDAVFLVQNWFEELKARVPTGP